jgi:hypothetical protein
LDFKKSDIIKKTEEYTGKTHRKYTEDESATGERGNNNQ